MSRTFLPGVTELSAVYRSIAGAPLSLSPISSDNNNKSNSVKSGIASCHTSAHVDNCALRLHQRWSLYTHCAFYHWRPHLSSDCCIGLEQFAGVSPVIAVVASFPQQTEKRTNFLLFD